MHFYLADFSVDFIKQFVSLWWWAIKKIRMYLISRFCSNREKSWCNIYACFWQCLAWSEEL